MSNKHKRRFTSSQRVLLFVLAGGRCSICLIRLEPGWHADHRYPWSKGGATDLQNGQALCPTCDLHKSDKVPPNAIPPPAQND